MKVNRKTGEASAIESAANTGTHPAQLIRELRHLFWGLKLYGVDFISRQPQSPVAQPANEGVVDAARDDRLRDIRRELGDCRRCRLHQNRTNLVFDDGTAAAPVAFVGEGPGSDEDRRGKPFVGKAGQLLDRMIRAMGLQRTGVYICNVVKCRPPQNRNPQEDEIAACSPFLFRQLEAVQPKVICALGACAAQTLTGKKISVARMRNTIHYWHGIPLVVTYHPAYLLRNPVQKGAVWEDLREVLGLIE